MAETYRSAGVDLDAAERAKARLKELVASTRDRYTLSELGSFGGLYQVPADAEQPVLVASADGVGTKLKVAFQANRHDTVGRDLVNHCVNDILVQGARPLFFLDYIALGAMDEAVVTDVVSGVARGLGTFCLDGILGSQHQERIRHLEGFAPDGHLPLLHHFEQRALYLGGGAVDFVCQQQIGKDRAERGVEFARLLIVDAGANQIGGDQVGRKLDALELTANGVGQGLDRHRLGQPRHAFDQDVSPRQQRHH
jgi:hypothetical protein